MRKFLLSILLLILSCEEYFPIETEEKPACLWETFYEKYKPPSNVTNYNYYCYSEFSKENDCIEKHEQIKDMNDFPKLITLGSECDVVLSLECSQIQQSWRNFYHGDTYWYGDHNCEEICEEYIKQDWGDCTICTGFDTTGACIQ